MNIYRPRYISVLLWVVDTCDRHIVSNVCLFFRRNYLDCVDCTYT